jgi:hypothetical protein
MMMENQKYLETEIHCYKSNILELTNEIKVHKEEIEKWLRY